MSHSIKFDSAKILIFSQCTVLWCKHEVILHQTSKLANMEDDEIILYTFDLPMYMSPHQISGLRTGYYELNNLLAGWQRYEYVIVGYSNIEDANEFISNNASASNRVGSMVAIISPNYAAPYSIVDHNMTIVMQDCNSLFDIRKRARRLVRENGIKALIIDDITKINCGDLKFGSKGNEYYQISRSLCQLCRELNIPVISLVPIIANGEVPQLSSFTSIGNLDQDADVVIFLSKVKGGKLTPLVAKNSSGGISDIYCQSSGRDI